MLNSGKLYGPGRGIGPTGSGLTFDQKADRLRGQVRRHREGTLPAIRRLIADETGSGVELKVKAVGALQEIDNEFVAFIDSKAGFDADRLGRRYQHFVQICLEAGLPLRRADTTVGLLVRQLSDAVAMIGDLFGGPERR